uniref:3-methyl-2-oxobutanoate dehydrogenase (2-methylpropanoyl-transferring) n=1 Tax=Lygus hesperus TaxID=30085 RepID=A0A0A9Y0P5_LYGHE
MDTALREDPNACVFGQDIGFGGVFRATVNLLEKYGEKRVFNTPTNEVGIVALGIGMASQGVTAIAEIQFADYLFPAFDQLTNEASKFRYRSGNQFNVASLTVRVPYGAVGHGGHYHSQSPEAYLTHTPGLTVVVPRDAYTAKGLLLSSISHPNPVVFLEPKRLYRSSKASIPVHRYEIPIRQAEVLRVGKDITVVGWGAQLEPIVQACDKAMQDRGISCEIIDLQTLLPWDVATVCSSVCKTGRCIVSHEAPLTSGFGAEIVATVQRECFYNVRMCASTPVYGAHTHTPFSFTVAGPTGTGNRLRHPLPTGL